MMENVPLPFLPWLGQSLFSILLYLALVLQSRGISLTWQCILPPGMMPITWQATNRDLLNPCQNE